MINHALVEDLQVRHTLVYGNKTFEDIIFRRQLEALQREHPDRIKVVHALSREQDVRGYGDQFQAGTDPKPRFLESALTALDEIGVPKAQIHRESYG